MRLFSKCSKCGKIRLFTKIWWYDMPYQKVRMKSENERCYKCFRQLKKGFKIMENGKTK